MRRSPLRAAGRFRAARLLPLRELQEARRQRRHRAGRIASDRVAIVAGEELLRTYQPPEGTAKTFCSVCGSNLFGGGWPESDRASVRLSAIDDSLEGRPTRHIWVRSLGSWETLPDDGLERDEQAG
jgi:hypothetical protein